MKKMIVFTFIPLLLAFTHSSATELDAIYSKLLYSSEQAAVCKTSSECTSITLGWSKCSIGGYEFAFSRKNKEKVNDMLEVATLYEKTWEDSVNSGKIPYKCGPQKFSKAECISGLCVLIGNPKLPKTMLKDVSEEEFKHDLFNE